MSTSNLFKLFFSGYFWVGLIVILFTVIIDQANPNKAFWLKVTLDVFETIGVAILIASIFTFASGTSEFINQIRNLLADIVVSRNFLQNINRESQQEALAFLIKPSMEEKKIYSNIEDYYNTYIKQVMNVTNKNVRSNYNITARAYLDKQFNVVVVESIISYRVYPTADGYTDVKVGFQDIEKTIDSTCEYIIVNANGKRIKHENLEFKIEKQERGAVRTATVDLSQYNDGYAHLDIELKMKEVGKDHWILLSFQALQPTDGFKHHIRCEDDLIISDFVTFIHGATFHIDNPSNNEMTISCSEWISEGTGLSIVISLPLACQSHIVSVEEHENTSKERISDT